MREPTDRPAGEELDERVLRELFPLDGGAGPAPRRSAAQLDQLLDAALDAFESPPPVPDEPPPSSPGASGPVPRLALVALGVVVLVGGAAWLLRAAETPDVAHSPAAPSAPATVAQSSSAISDGLGPATAVGTSVPSDGPSDGRVTDNVAPQAGHDDPGEAVQDAEPETTADDGRDPAPRLGMPSRAPSEASDPRDLLREANALRGQSQFAAAERLYVRVAREHPGSSSAYVAKVAAASLRLERLGNARGALSLYRAALRESPNGSLVQEVRRGIALSQRRLGARAAEAQALRDFVVHHPGVPFANAARARLAELEAGSADAAADQPE